LEDIGIGFGSWFALKFIRSDGAYSLGNLRTWKEM